MRKKLTALAVAMCAAGAAHAAGPYDGIYVNLNGGFASVHTNGDQIIVIGLTSVSATNIYFNSALGTIRPTSIEQWDVGQGNVNGNVAVIAGTAFYGACAYQMRITFSPNQGVAQTLSASNTQVGNASGVNCSVLANSQATTLLRAF